MEKKILLAAAVFLVDWLLYFLPFTAIFLIYVMFFKPVWFRDWVLAIYNDSW